MSPNYSKLGHGMKNSRKNLAIGIGLALAGLLIGAGGIYVGHTDDAPGAGLLGILLMLALVGFGSRKAWRR